MTTTDKLSDDALENIVQGHFPAYEDSAAMARELLGHRRASQSAPAQPTEAMLDAARDWSDAKYGKPIGNDAAIGCWNAMLAAAPAPTDGLRDAWIAGRDAAAAEAFYACGCKDSIEAITPPAAYSRAAPTEGET